MESLENRARVARLALTGGAVSITMGVHVGRLAQRLERPAYTGKVRGSNP
jgi:hypothetical protein